MKWLGEKLKEFVASKYGSQEEFCARIKVTRQAFSAWCNGDKIPNGKSLIAIARELKISLADLFEDSPVVAPQFMHKHNAISSPDKEKAARELADEYNNIITSASAPVLSSTCNLTTNDYARLAQEFRKLGDMSISEPMDYDNVFILAEKLNICIIFREFSEDLKNTYAFYCLINNIDVIFVDKNACVSDLIFVLLHEICHAVRRNEEYSAEEDEFCDKVADEAQFPELFLIPIEDELNKASSFEEQFVILKKAATRCSLYGIYKAMERRQKGVKWHFTSDDLKLRVGQLNDECVKLKNILAPTEASIETVCVRYIVFSSIFVNNFLLPHLNDVTDRFIAQIFDLASGEDGKAVRSQLMTMSNNKGL